jgi:hypothetical protein
MASFGHGLENTTAFSASWLGRLTLAKSDLILCEQIGNEQFQILFAKLVTPIQYPKSQIRPKRCRRLNFRHVAEMRFSGLAPGKRRVRCQLDCAPGIGDFRFQNRAMGGRQSPNSLCPVRIGRGQILAAQPEFKWLENTRDHTLLLTV